MLHHVKGYLQQWNRESIGYCRLLVVELALPPHATKEKSTEEQNPKSNKDHPVVSPLAI